MNGRKGISVVVGVYMFLLVLSGPVWAVTHYVSAGQSIQAAIDDPCTVDGDEIEVAPGTYFEAIDFKGKAVCLYSSGGPEVTTITANWDGVSVVICNHGEDANTILNGFTITGGTGTTNAHEQICGGGMRNESSSPTVTNCIFINNSAEYGAGIYNYDSSPTVINCIFTGNTANVHGGGTYSDGGSIAMTNCTFTGNSAVYGGAIYNNGSSYTVINCILWEDTASTDGDEIALKSSSSIDVNYSDVMGGSADIYNDGGTGSVIWGLNIDQDPLFLDADGIDNIAGNEDDCLLLRLGSPCIDAGDNSAVTEATDPDGRPRIFDGDGDGTAIVDMGAYEKLPSKGIIFTADFTEPNIITNGIILEPEGLYWNEEQAGGPMASWKLIDFMEGSFTGAFYLDEVKVLYLTVTHLSSADSNCSGGGYAPIDITVNCENPWTPGPENIIFEDYDVAEHHGGSHEFQTDTFLIPPSKLHEGKNTITFLLKAACSEYWIQYMSAEEASAGMYGTVIGVDSKGLSSPLVDANVTLSRGVTDINASTTDNLGYFGFLDIPPGDYTVTVTKSDYWDFSRDINIKGDETLHKVFQMASKSPSLLPMGYDFLSPNGKHFIEGTYGDIGFKISIIWNGSPGYVDFFIGDNCYNADVQNLEGQFAIASLTIPTPDIVNNPSKLIIDIVNGEGNHTYLYTDVRFHPLPGIINSWYGDNIPWSLWPSGARLSYRDEMSWNWQLPIKKGDASFNASVGYDRSLCYDLMSGSFGGYLGGFGGFGLNLPVTGITILGEGRANLAATLDVCLNEGPPVITPGWQVSFAGKAGVEAPVILVVEVIFPPATPAINTMLKVPVVKDIIKALRVRLYVIGGASIKGIYEGGELGDCFLGSSQIDVAGTIGVEIQIIYTLGDAEVSVYAGGTGTPSFQICPDFKFNSITIHAYIGASAEWWWFKFSKEYGCNISFGSSSKGAQSLSDQLFGTALLEPDVTWELASDSLKRWGPANRPVANTIRELSFTPKNGGTGTETQTIAENVIGTASPSVVSDASQTMLLFSLHDVNKPDPCASDIGTFISTGGGVWSAGRITDDSNSDFVAKVISIGSDAYLAAWERIYGDVSEVIEPNKVDQVYPYLEIAASWFDRNAGAWSELAKVTSNNVVDRSPLPIIYGSTIGIIWIQNDANYIGNSEYGDRLMFSEWNDSNSTWAPPQQLWSGPYGILDISFTSDSLDQGHIVFAVDLDGNTDDTRTDRELYRISTSAGIWGVAERLTNNDVEDSCPVLVNPSGTAILVWDCNDTLLYTPLGVWNPEQVYSQYTLYNEAPSLAGVTMADGAAIAYTVQVPSGADIMASFYDEALDRWSLPRQLTFDEDVESAVSFGFDGERLIAAYLKTLTERKDIWVNIEGEDYYLENIPEPGRTDLCILQHTLGYDLGVDSNSIIFEPANPEPGSAATIKATVENRGDLGVEDIAVVFYDGDPNSGGSIIGDTQTITENLIPGGANEISITWNVPAYSSSHEIFVVVDPCLVVDDRDRSNNTASKFTALPDVEVENAWSTELSPNLVMLVARIANTGVTAAKNITVSWRIDSEQGTEIGSDLISTLACGGAYEASCLWDTNGVFDSNSYIKVFGSAFPADDAPECDRSNNVFSLVINKQTLVVNHSPFACIEGGDRVVDVGADCQSPVVLEGSCSSDADSTAGTNDDINDFDWYEVIDVCDPNSDVWLGSGEVIECNLGLGECLIILEVTDKAGAFDSNEVVITVEDTTAPLITLNGSEIVVLECGIDSYVEEGATATDNCDDDVPVVIGGDVVDTLTCGMYVVTYDATDDWGNAAEQVVREVIVEDTIPPQFTLSVEPDVLWPPNHKMVKVTTSLEVSDNCDESPEVSLVDVTSSEDDDSRGKGRTSKDITIGDNGSIYLRAERSGKGTGRIYTITYQAVDDSGNVTVNSTTVTVPHSRARSKERHSPPSRLHYKLLRRLRGRVQR